MSVRRGNEKEKSNRPSQNEQSEKHASLFYAWRTEFIDKIAHDLKTPFFGAREILQLILNGGCGEIQPELEPLLFLLKQTNEELIEMTQRLLDIYRYEAGRDSLKISPVNLVALIKQSVLELQTFASANEISLSCQSNGKEFKVALDQSAIERALTGLLVTCIKNTEPGGSLNLKLEHVSKTAVLTLCARGLGIGQKELDSIFLLARQQSASKSYAPLAGLDLHLCRQIICAHGGTISTTQDKDGTTAIVISIPIEL